MKNQSNTTCVGKIDVVGVFVPVRVTKVEAGTTTDFGVEFCCALVRLEQNVDWAAPDSKMRDVGLSTSE